jgi:ketosteroid isomerase-like protein
MAIQVSNDIEAINNLREKVFETGNIWDFIDGFADDMVWMPPGESAIVGKAACREWAKRLDGTNVEISTQSEEITATGDWAFERFVEIQVFIAENGTKSPPHTLQCMWTLRRKADDSWEIVHFIWNGNPSPAA